MGRKACCEKIGLKKDPWTADEDKKLRDFIQTNGTQYCCWRAVPKFAGLLRCGKSCRLRWANYLRPDLKSDRLSEEEEMTVIDLHSKFGNRWSKIASNLRGRTDNYIKNYWHNHLKKKLIQMGIDPVTHKPLIHDAPDHLDRHSNKSKKKGRKNGEEMREDDLDIAMNNLAIDSGFSIDEIPVVQPHEIIIPLTNDCSSSYISTPSASSSTSTSPSNINLLVQKISNYQRKAYTQNMGYYTGNMGCSCEDDSIDWDWLLNNFDINEINHEMLHNSW